MKMFKFTVKVVVPPSPPPPLLPRTLPASRPRPPPPHWPPACLRACYRAAVSLSGGIPPLADFFFLLPLSQSWAFSGDRDQPLRLCFWRWGCAGCVAADAGHVPTLLVGWCWASFLTRRRHASRRASTREYASATTLACAAVATRVTTASMVRGKPYLRDLLLIDTCICFNLKKSLFSHTYFQFIYFRF